ncbi:MAG: hypothetical protein ABH879_07880 [archaeon]
MAYTNRICLYIIAVLILIEGVPGSFYEITYTCKDDVCISGKDVVWNLTITNKDQTKVEYSLVEIIDAVNKSPIAMLSANYQPLSSDRGDLITLEPMSTYTLDIAGKLPAANVGDRLVYNLCFSIPVPSQHRYYIAKGIYEQQHCYPINESIIVYECATSGDCPPDKQCLKHDCKAVVCGSCEYIVNHGCQKYQCCSDATCKSYEKCENHVCQRLNCSGNERVANHSCSPIVCADDEHFVNGSCVMLACAYDEYIYNHSCMKLDCADNQYIQDHQCFELQCREFESAADHECRVLNCGFNETVYNHSCVAVDCWMFEDIVDHGCRTNTGILARIVGEVIAIVAIVTLASFVGVRAYHIYRGW